ncbi:MAG TPA: electron transfer flavoprotein subunit beta/FixA family protein [Streptosporangiaceae bacterium]|nr:electron transfer flavoprotein subunit beta/FixA family protein [Streptosporangiaceae bacterium]
MLRITALVKYVPELTDRRFAADFTLDRDAAPGRLSELDEHTAEQAISLAEARRADGGEAELTYLTMGPPSAADALRKALSMGGDRAVHVLDPAMHGSDAQATSLALASAIKRIGYDVVVCGMASTDAGLGLVPAMVAERLQVPQISLASSLALNSDRVTIERESQLATETIEGTLPALVSVTDRTGEARYPSFKGIIAAKKKPLQTWSLGDLGIAEADAGLQAAYTKVLSATARLPRGSGELVADEGDGGTRLARFLSTQKFI